MSADLCAFFVKHFHVFKKPVEYLEFSINFYTDKHSKLTQNFLNLSEEKKKRKENGLPSFLGNIFHFTTVTFAN